MGESKLSVAVFLNLFFQNQYGYAVKRKGEERRANVEGSDGTTQSVDQSTLHSSLIFSNI